MQTKIGQRKRSIAESFSRIGNYLTLTNGLGYTEFNSDAERFFIDILNVTYGYSLRDMNIEKPNFPAIDLADDRKKVCIQVTTTGTNQKFIDTIKVFNNNKLNEKYEKLVFVVLSSSDSITKKTSGIQSQVVNLSTLLRDISNLSDQDIEYLDDYIKEYLLERDDSGSGLKKGITYTLGNATAFVKWSQLEPEDTDSLRQDLKGFAETLSNLTNQQRSYIFFLVTFGHTPQTGQYWDKSDHIYVPSALEQQHYSGLDLFNSVKALNLVHLDDEYDQHGDERYVTALVVSYRGAIDDFNYIAKIKSFLAGDSAKLRRIFINCDFTPLN